MRILFTGFDPFGGEKINPAGEAVKMMKNEIQGAEILKLEVPTVFGKAGEVLKKAVEQYRPDAVAVSYTHLNPENYVLGEPSHRICSTKEEELFDK